MDFLLISSITYLYDGFLVPTCLAAGVDGSSNDHIELFFDTTPRNITVIAGEKASLECYVEAKGTHQVVWMNPKKTVLTNDNSRITDDMRISVEREFVRDWHLHIRDVTYKDRGDYTCFINTEPPKMKIVYLDVKVPPTIISTSPSTKKIVREGETVELICNATGVPPPTITWIRKSWDTDRRREEQETINKPGECLLIHNITRYCDGTFECVASNGVKKNVSAKIEVEVAFPPEVTMTNQRLGQFRGKETILECTIHASPFAIFKWERNGKKIVTTTGRYRLDFYDEAPHIKKLSLHIFALSAADYGQYSCYAQNKYGTDRESMLLYESETSTRRRTTPTTKLTTSPSIISQSPYKYGSYSNIGVTLLPGTAGLSNSSRKLTCDFILLNCLLLMYILNCVR